MKVCTKCDKEKVYEDFLKRKDSLDGYTGVCRECRNFQKKEWLKANPGWLKERRSGYHKTYKENNPEKVKENDRAQNLKHRKRKTENAKKWRHKNPHKVKESNARNKGAQRKWATENVSTIRESQKRWRKRNPDKVAAVGAERRAREVNATPPWLTRQHRKQIATFFKEAKTREEFHEIQHHVDHIEPLKGVNENREHVSCGLHVPWNLQVLTYRDNVVKSNKLST